MPSTKEIVGMDDVHIILAADLTVRSELGRFIREFNRREWFVRISKESSSFKDYVDRHYEHKDDYGTGFVVDGNPVPYFHPNRSFHDEVIWLNNNLFYRNDVSFGDKVLNAAIVKFYGPSRTLEIITENTGEPFINFTRFREDEDYAHRLMSNIEIAFKNKQQIWGTTELRTTLQVASRNLARQKPNLIDIRGIPGYGKPEFDPDRKMRPSDMIQWVAHLAVDHEENGRYVKGLVDYYSQKPTMQESYEFLTAKRGIGPYYGYHFSSNLARLPGVGAPPLIEAEWSDKFRELGVDHGNLDENADYVVAGPGASNTLKMLYPGWPINQQTTMRMLIAIRNHQKVFFMIHDPESTKHLRESTELGLFTTFGCEISCCQFAVYKRLQNDPVKARIRAAAPISKEV